MLPTLDYGALLATATSAIHFMGRAAQLMTFDGSSTVTVTALISNYGIRERDGTLIGRDDRRAIIAAEGGVVPDPEMHRLVMDSTSFRIVSVRPLNPAGTVLYFDCQVRGK